MNSTTRLQATNLELQPKPICTITIGASESSTLCFEELFQSAVDEVFSSLGESCRCAIYRHIQRRFALDKAEIAAHPNEFIQAVEGLFGPASAVLLIAIMKVLHNRVPDFRYSEVEGSFSFVGYVDRLRSFLTA